MSIAGMVAVTLKLMMAAFVVWVLLGVFLIGGYISLLTILELL